MRMDDRAQALEALYRERYPRFLNTLATITGSWESAHDAVQEAFARAYANRRRWRGESSLETWVWRIALRTAVGFRRDLGRTPLNGSFDPRLVDPAPDPELDEALRALPPKRRLVVFLRYFADLPYREIAQICGTSEGTVAATLAQAREALHETMTKQEAR
jgi:RNA polymerase sigma-70 factor (ECF subfamily)